jgi:type IV pilus assembly protein PilY1
MKKIILTILTITANSLPLIGHCDDTEIHLGNSFTALEPNVLFIMDTSTSMAWKHDEDEVAAEGEDSRLDTVKRIATDTIKNTENINIGLMSFNTNNQGATLDLALTPVASARTDFDRIMKGYIADGGTPITESLEEALRYFSGDNVKYGSSGAASAMNSEKNQYHKPIENQCQKNHIILFSDGAPSGDYDSNDDILDEINSYNDPRKSDLNSLADGEKCSSNGSIEQLDSIYWYGNTATTSDGEITYTYSFKYQRNNETHYVYNYRDISGICAEELALLAQLKNISSVSGIHQNVTVHTVGGFVGGDAQEKLKNIAKFGSPVGAVKPGPIDPAHPNAPTLLIPSTYYAATTESGLAAEFKALLTSIRDEGSTFSAPSVSVNAFNSLELSDELYYALFKPSKKSDWVGNLKRYQLKQTSTAVEIVGEDGQPAIDTNTALFLPSAVSYWGDDAIDGADVTKGGIAQHLGSVRKIKTTRNGSLVNFASISFSAEELDIADPAISTRELATYQQRLLSWAQGIDIDAGPYANGFDAEGNVIPRLSIEDPLHSEPTIITYSSSTDSSGNKSQNKTLFLGTNSGFLHAFNIDEATPREHFSFIPKELLQNLNKYYSGGSFHDHKTYGLDGPLTHWHVDTNGNAQVDDNEQVYLFITMRRGGQSLYALNVTNPDNPSLLWQKHGNYPSDFPNRPAISNGYDNLGQTWARLEPATVMWKGSQKVVLFTAGGYDPAEDGTTSDGPTSRSEHTKGTTIYMIDALSGEVLWDAKTHSDPASPAEFTSSFAANVSPVDSTGDGMANIVFAADTGGRIWRFDIKSDHASTDRQTDFAKSFLIADISSGSGAGNRRFFNEVDVIRRQKDKDILLSIGSGYRAHPLSLVVTDYHYMIRTPLVNPTNHTIIESDLVSWGSPSDYGWKIPLTYPGEKVLSRSNTSANTTLFTTFAPKSNNAADLCSADPGIATIYVLGESLNHYSLVQGGIPSMPVIIRNKKALKKGATTSARSILVGLEVVDLPVPIGNSYDHVKKKYWLEKR